MRILLIVLLILGLCSPAYALDRRIIYDADGTELNLNSDGTVPVTISSGTVTTVSTVTDVTTVGTITNEVAVEQNGHASLSGGRTVITSSIAGVSIGTAACKRVVVQNPLGNSGNMVIGGSGAIADPNIMTGGISLDAGEEAEFFVDNISDVYASATVTGEVVIFYYEN